MRRVVLGIAVAVTSLAGAAAAIGHEFDHPVPTFAPQGPLSSEINAGGTDAQWELITTIPTGNPHSDLDFFTNGGDTYASVGTLAAGPNAGGQTIVQLTDEGQVDPEYVTGHPSASCVSTTSSITGLQHDVEAAPKGNTLFQQPNPYVDMRDTQILVDATDANGRCHDQGVLGQQAPRGGLEIIDVTNPAQPKEIGLTSHVGESHTVNVDPKRPHIAFSATSDSVAVNADGSRANDTGGNAHDGFEVIDMSSCMNFPPATTLQQKRDACRPQVYRYRYPSPDVAIATAYRSVGACHEVEIYPDDKLACASLTATILFDLSGAFDDRGTPTDFSDDRPRGTPLPCRVRDTSTTAPAFRTGAKVTDCVMGEQGGQAQSLIVAEWLKIGAPSLEGVRRIGTAHHMGLSASGDAATAPRDSREDIFVSHEAELTENKQLILATDERGGGVVPPGASCSPGADNVRGNGGIHAYRVNRLFTSPPANFEAADAAYARTSEGQKAIYRARTRTGPQGSACTSHVFHRIPGENRIFMGWYSQGTQVVDFVENANGTIDFKEAAWFTPENASTWTSHIFKRQCNQDGTVTYWGATGDFLLLGAGRNAIDVYKVTLPAPPRPRTANGEPVPGTPACELSDVRGVENAPERPSCTRRTAFETVRAAPRGRGGLRFTFNRRSQADVRVELFRHSRGSRQVIGARRVRDFGNRRGNFNWRGDRRLPDGYYVARFTTTSEDGSVDVRRVALRRAHGRFRFLRVFDRRSTCELLERFYLGHPVFGGTRNVPLTMRFRLAESARVSVEVRRRGRLVHRFRAREYQANRSHRLAVRLPRGSRRGDYRITLRAVRPGKTTTATLAARRL